MLGAQGEAVNQLQRARCGLGITYSPPLGRRAREREMLAESFIAREGVVC
jgi:hypothetical protein